MTSELTIREKYIALRPSLDERARRLWAATEAKALGRGGVAVVGRATGMSPNTLARGMRELAGEDDVPAGRVRKSGGGRKRATALNPDLSKALDALIEPTTRGDPESPLRWTLLSTRQLAAALKAQGFQVSHTLVSHLLHAAEYSLRGNRKTLEGTDHPDRDAQFQHIARRVKAQLRRGQPSISVDTKKKELVGNYKNNGKEWRPKGTPRDVKVHDFVDPALGKAIPYGVYDVGLNAGWVSVGVTHDTGAFAVATIGRWWKKMGRRRYPEGTSLLITADSGGSNGPRLRLWKWELQRLADAKGLTIHVCHLPPGTSKWNKIEHRLFSFISGNWRGRPLLTLATIVQLIAATTTTSGLTVRCELDTDDYPRKVKITDAQMKTIRLEPESFHGEWNYTIRPRLK